MGGGDGVTEREQDGSEGWSLEVILNERLSTSPSSAPALFEAAEVPKSLETDTSSENTTGVSMFKLYIRRS